MKTIDQIHRENLQTLVREYEGVAAVALKIGCSPSQYSQWMHGSENSGTGKRRGMRPSSARRIEKACGKPEGWMDRSHSAPDDWQDRKSNVIGLHPDDPLPTDTVFVPESKIEFSAGNGRVPVYELLEEQEPATYRLSWFRQERINPERARRFRVSGDSMEPMLYARDTILVNTDETDIVDGKLYAIRYGDELRVKYLFRRLDGTLILRSVNSSYKDEEVSAELAEEHIAVIGRVRDKSGKGGL